MHVTYVYLAYAGGGAGDEDDLAGDAVGEDRAEEGGGEPVDVVGREEEQEQRGESQLQRYAGQPAHQHRHRRPCRQVFCSVLLYQGGHGHKLCIYMLSAGRILTAVQETRG